MSEKVCDECGFPIEHSNGNINNMVLLKGKWYCNDGCLAIARNKIREEKVKRTKLYEKIKAIATNCHDSTIIAIVDAVHELYPGLPVV